MKNKTPVKSPTKVKAGYMRAENYHKRNCDALVLEVVKKMPKTHEKVVKQTVVATYALFREQFRFFKK